MDKQQKYSWREIDRVEEEKRAATARLSDFQQTYRAYDELTAREQASRCVQCPHANCIAACPLELPIPELLALTAEGQFKAAAELLLTTQSLPEFFAHVCVEGRLCEAACVVGAKSEPIPINAISRFLLDYGWKHGVSEPAAEPFNGQRVLVVGSGLCGLVAADALSRLGYGVTVMDSMPKPGGRLMNGLPGFRLDKAVIGYRIQMLRERGVQFRMAVDWSTIPAVGELRRSFDAVFIGFGRTNPVPLEIPGASLRGVCQAYPFVVQETSDLPLSAPPIDVEDKRVLVLGGSETAVNAARVALRCHAREAACLYRRDEASMPANPIFYEEAVEEGVGFHFLSQAVAVLGNEAGNVAAVRCARTKLVGVDGSGRGIPCVVPESEFDVPADVVLIAYGFTPPLLPPGRQFAELRVDNRGCLIVNSNQMTNIPGVFAGGSIVRGALTLPEVVTDARHAVEDINTYLTARRHK
ncbi:MAG: FAD-dependent oxidoreductase [Limisphaerales bacterium]